VRQTVTGKIFTIPNLLSLVRLILLPVFFVLLVQYENNVMAFLVILAASLTDLIDGPIARATHTVSRLGQWLDPFVDRVFIIVGIIAIYVAGRVPLWILLLLLGRDACMLVLTVYQKRRFNRNFKVIFLGKFTTALVMAGFCSLVLWWPILPSAHIIDISFLPGWGSVEAPLGVWLLYAGVIVSWITAAIYLYRGLKPDPRDVRDSREEAKARENIEAEAAGTAAEAGTAGHGTAGTAAEAGTAGAGTAGTAAEATAAEARTAAEAAAEAETITGTTAAAEGDDDNERG
jgi:cardiolipin synthase